MNAKVVSCLMLFCASVAQATNYYWYPVDGVSDGAFTDLTHWKLNAQTASDHIPGLYDEACAHKGDNAFFRSSDQASSVTQYTVTYPSGDYTNFAGMAFQLTREIGITLKGEHLNYPCPSDNSKVGNNGFLVQMGYPTLHQMYAYDFNGNAINDSVFDFTDFELTMTNAEHESRIEFVRGKFVFPTGAYKRLFVRTQEARRWTRFRSMRMPM